MRGRWEGAKEDVWDLLREVSQGELSQRKVGQNLSFCFTLTSLLVFFHYHSFTDVKILQVSESSIKQYIPTGYC